VSDVTLHLGDCIDVLPTLTAESIDLTVTSPPYDNLRKYNGYTFDAEAVARELWRVTKPGGVVVWVVGDETKNGSESGTSFRQAFGVSEPSRLRTVLCTFWPAQIFLRSVIGLNVFG